MKYIIEIEDEPFVRLSALFGEEGLYRAKGLKSLVFDQFGLDKLTPLDKALSSELGEAYHKGFEAGQHEATTLEYQQGLDDAWETIIKLAHTTYAQRSEIFDGQQDILSIVQKFSPSEVTAKLREYEQQKADAEDSEIKVGDEVMSNNAISDHTGVVLALSPGENSAKVLENDGGMAWVAVNVLIKTGRHFNFLTPLLNEMKEGAE